MKRPAWAAAPYFARCWAVTELMCNFPNMGDNYGEIVRMGMGHARVVSISREQVESTPRLWPGAENVGQTLNTHEAAARLSSVRSPFPEVFFDLGCAHVGGTLGGALAGCLVLWLDSEETLSFLPFFRSQNGFVVPPPGSITVGETSGLNRRWLGPVEEDPETTVDEYEQALIESVNMVGGILELLQSVNVELDEAPMKPQARERQIKKGREIALTVQVKQSKRRVSRPSESRADFSHRFEVRGHYTHHFETKPDGTPNKVFERYSRLHPDKVLTIQDQSCVRFWTPPYVKGPEDKPFVPKIRVVESDAA